MHFILHFNNLKRNINGSLRILLNVIIEFQANGIHLDNKWQYRTSQKMSAQRNTFGAYVLSLSLDLIFLQNCKKYTYTEHAERFRCAIPRFTQKTKRSPYISNRSYSVTFSLLHLSSHLTETTVYFSCLDRHLFRRPQLIPHRN